MENASVKISYFSNNGTRCEIKRTSNGFCDSYELGKLIGAALQITDWDLGMKSQLVTGLIEALTSADKHQWEGMMRELVAGGQTSDEDFVVQKEVTKGLNKPMSIR